MTTPRGFCRKRMLFLLILAVANFFAPTGGFGKALLFFNAVIIALCLRLAAVWNARPPEYNEWGIREHPPEIPLFVACALLFSSLFLALRCFLPKARARRKS